MKEDEIKITFQTHAKVVDTLNKNQQILIKRIDELEKKQIETEKKQPAKKEEPKPKKEEGEEDGSAKQ